MRIKRIDFDFGLFVLAALAFNTPPTSALSLHSCQCSSEAQWQAQAILWSTGDHYLYNLDAQAIRKYNVHHRNGGTQPLAIGAGTSARMHHQAVAAGHAVPQAQNLVADQQPVEAIYLDAFADWVLAHELTDGTMKTTVTYDLGIHGTPIGFPNEVANGDIYEFASTSSRQNDLTDWIANLVESHGQDLPTAAAQALAQLTDSTLQLDSNTTIFFVFVLSNGQRIFVTWNKNQPHPEISELRDANNNTVPRSPGQVGGTYSFSGHTTEYARFINYLGQMGVSIEEPSGGSLWIVACTTAGGVTRCVPVRSY